MRSNDAGFSVTPVAVLRFPYPVNDSYLLQPDAAYILPLNNADAGAFDVATAQSKLWMVYANEVSRTHMGARGALWLACLVARLAPRRARCRLRSHMRGLQAGPALPIGPIRCWAQVASFDLSKAAPTLTQFSVSDAVSDAVEGVQFQAMTVRVVSSDSTATTLLVGGVDTNSSNPYSALVIYISVLAGSVTVNTAGIAVLPSDNGGGVTALSQENDVHPGYVLASTNEGVFKCVRMASLFS